MIPNQKNISENLITGGQPTQEDFQNLKNQGFEVVLNMRAQNESPSPAEERAWVESLNMEYVQFPIAGGESLTLENTKRFDKHLSEFKNKKMLIHCGSGNRIGAFFAMKSFFLDQKSKKDSIEIGKKCGLTQLEAIVSEKLKK